MLKTTVYLPEEMEARLEAESLATGTSKAELIRRAVAMLLQSSNRPSTVRPLPVFDSGRSRSADEMNETITDRISERAARR